MNGKDPVMPIIKRTTEQDGSTWNLHSFEGMDIRTSIAKDILVSLVSKYSFSQPSDQKIVCQLSVELADQLVIELNR